MVFGEVVTKVVFSRLPVNANVALVDTVWYPMEAHVHGFGALEFGGAVCKATGRGIVSGDACRGRLWVPHFLEDCSEEHGFLAIVEQGTNFSLGRGSHDIFKDARFHMDGAIGCGDLVGLVMVAQVEETTHT